MTNEAAARAAERKAKLLIDGTSYRIGLLQSKVAVTQGLRAESLIRSALESTVGFAGAQMVTSLIPTGARVRTLMPFAMAGISTLLRQKLRYLVLGAGIVAVTATIVTVVRKRRGTIIRKQSGR